MQPFLKKFSLDFRGRRKYTADAWDAIIGAHRATHSGTNPKDCAACAELETKRRQYDDERNSDRRPQAY
jgi:hypothetical protein